MEKSGILQQFYGFDVKHFDEIPKSLKIIWIDGWMINQEWITTLVITEIKPAFISLTNAILIFSKNQKF